MLSFQFLPLLRNVEDFQDGAASTSALSSRE